LWLALGAGVMAVLCLGGIGVIVSLYDGATEVKRSDPSVVLFNFMGAYLTDRNDQEAALYVCEKNSDISRLKAFRDDVEGIEKRYSVKVVITWKDLTVKSSGDRATATADIVRSITDGSERTATPWKFELVDDGGWRVCSAAPAP
jgi:hypothetical protein